VPYKKGFKGLRLRLGFGVWIGVGVRVSGLPYAALNVEGRLVRIVDAIAV